MRSGLLNRCVIGMCVLVTANRPGVDEQPWKSDLIGRSDAQRPHHLSSIDRLGATWYVSDCSSQIDCGASVMVMVRFRGASPSQDINTTKTAITTNRGPRVGRVFPPFDSINAMVPCSDSTTGD